MRIRFVIPTLNNCMLTVQTVSSIRAELPREELDIVIVDNGSTDETLAVMRADTDQKGSGIRVISNPEPRAYARSVNMGAALDGDWDLLIVANNDVILGPGSIEAMLGALSPFSELVLPISPRCAADKGISPPRISRPKDLEAVYANVETIANWHGANAGRLSPTGNAIVTHAYVKQGGYCFGITRRLWDLLGGMDEAYKLFGEDYDLFDRAMRHTKMIQAGGAYVDHLEHQTCAHLGDERDERMARSRFLLAEKREGLKELVSIIVPTYNRTEALFEAIDSVIRQTVPHWRLYVVDDGSKDWDRIQTAAVERYRGHENRIWFFHRKKNAGPGAARNYGLGQARGKYVAFLDSDDIWHVDHLEKHLAVHEGQNVAMSYSETSFAWRWFDEERRRFNYKREKHPEPQLSDWSYSRERIEAECFIKTSAVMFWGGLFRVDDEGSMPFRFIEDPDHRSPNGVAEDWELFKEISRVYDVAHIPFATAQTNWSKNPLEEGHHSARLNPWADFGEAPAGWFARELVSVGEQTAPVTAIIPTRERASDLEKCLRSLGSTPAIVVCDGKESKRDALRIVQNRPDTGLLVIDQPKGPSNARNRGVEAATTEWLWFLDDDDIALPGWLERISPLMDGADVIIGELLASTCDEGLKHAEGVYTSGLFIRRETFALAAGFDESLAYAEERDLLKRLEKHGARIVELGLPVAVKTTGALKRTAVSSLTSEGPIGPNFDPR